jgi:hypothetical protein
MPGRLAWATVEMCDAVVVAAPERNRVEEPIGRWPWDEAPSSARIPVALKVGENHELPLSVLSLSRRRGSQHCGVLVGSRRSHALLRQIISDGHPPTLDTRRPVSGIGGG